VNEQHQHEDVLSRGRHTNGVIIVVTDYLIGCTNKFFPPSEEITSIAIM